MTAQQKRLVELLLMKTRNRDLSWELVTPTRFAATVGELAVTVESKEDPFTNSTDYYISLINEESENVDQFSDVDLDRDEPPTANAANRWYAAMRELFDGARRNARGSDKVLDELIRSLEG